ncbi:MAG: hypothetical protein QGH60_02450 [Phycisphaerae bacterium]|nr:hypothetical protein [Phycisphaerae bacterium]
MKKMKWIAIAVVLAATLMGPFADLAGARGRPAFAAVAAGDPKEIVQQQLRRYTATYDLNDDDQAKIEKILTAQHKDIVDFAKVHGPKIKVVDDQIKKLQDEIRELEKSKSVQLKVLAELQLDHKAELDGAITAEHKAARMAAYLKGYDTAVYWKFLPREVQATLNQKCQTVAMELISGGDVESKTAFKDARRKLQASVDKTLTPELRQAAEAKYLQESAIRIFARCKLTDDQKTRIGELCAKGVKDKIAASGRYSQLSKDVVAMKRAMSKYKGSFHSHSIRSEVVAKILTEEQRKRLPGKYRTAARKSKKDKKDKSRTRKSKKQAAASS